MPLKENKQASKNSLWWVLAAAITAPAGVALWAFRGNQGSASLHRPIPVRAPVTPAPESSPSSDDEAPSAGDDAVPNPLSFSDFIRELEQRTDEDARPGADAMLRELRSDPTATAVYQDFRRRHIAGAPLTAATFLGELRKLPSFDEFLEAESKDSGVRAAFAILAEQAGLRGLLDPPSRAARAAAEAAHSRGFRAREAAGRSPRRLLAGRAGAMPGGADASGGAVAPIVLASAGLSLGKAGGSSETKLDVGAAGASAPDVPAQMQALKTPATARMEALLEKYPFLGQAFTVDQLKDMVGDIDHFGLWGACFLHNDFAKCHGACENAQGGTSCVVGSGWRECLDAFGGDEAGCLARCRAQPPCSVDPAAWDRLCVQPRRQAPPQPVPASCGAADGGDPATAGGGCQYPVSSASPPACVVKAFNESGYYAALAAAVRRGLYPPSYLDRVKKDPVSWLKSHPYLTAAYGRFFK